MTEILLLLAGFIGGVLNTLAGGGSFVVFPALLLAGVPPVLANTSNTYAALPGYVSGAFGLREHIARFRHLLPLYSVVALVFGYAGAELLLHISNAQFTIVVPWLMLFAVLLFAFGGRINEIVASYGGGRRHLRLAGTALLTLLLAALSTYGGFFNAGFGILLLAYLALSGISDIHAMNGLKLWLSSLVAVVAVARFALAGSIAWYEGSIALVGIVIGAYVAARVSRFIPRPVIRAAVLIYGVGITIYFFWQAYFA